MRAEQVRAQIENWLMSTKYTDFLAAMEKRIIGQPDLKIVVANVYNYLINIVAQRPVNNNMLLAAPSGSGKTETYRALRDYFEDKIPDMPIYAFDTSLLTASGYKGAEPYEICAPFFNMDMEDAIGICFLDEFDKKLMPSFNSNGFDTNAEAQSNMLTIVEGTILNSRTGGVVDTSNIMFIGLGSFDDFRKKRESVSKTLGFVTENNKETIEHFTPVDREAMIESGGTYELLGRFPVIINYGKLTEVSIRRIIKKTVTEIERNFNCDIILTEGMTDELLKVANSNFGCRTFDSVVRSNVLLAYAKAMETKEEDKILTITIDTNNNVTYTWRDLNEIELLERKSYEQFLERIRKRPDIKTDDGNKKDGFDWN